MFAQVSEPLSAPPEPVPPYVDPYEPGLFSQGVFPLFYLLVLALKIWMLVECIRRDPDRYLWVWIILIVPLGSVIYFFVRWLPSNNVRLPSPLRALARGKEIDRLAVAAAQIGNAHQYIQLGDALRETGRHEQAAAAYGEALEKDPEDTQALWGAGQVDIARGDFPAARDRLQKLLTIDPQYRFGDVSLAYGKTLCELEEMDAAYKHLEDHVRRWRHPESMFLLATIDAEQGRHAEARQHLQAMLLDINGSPRAIARKYAIWKSKARKLLKRLSRPSQAV